MNRAIVLLSAITALLGGIPCKAGVGQSAVITLVFPFGARSYAMGEVGTALADDGSVLFFNPAGLGVPNEKWIGGSAAYFHEPLLPAFHLRDLWHRAVAANFQDSLSTWGQIGLFCNFIDMGTNNYYDELGRIIGRGVHSYEAIWALGWGFDFKEFGISDHYFGLTAKFINSVLAPGIGPYGAGTANSFAIDFGYLWTIGYGFRFGATLMNMGPSVYYLSPDNSDPIPFTMNLAAAWKKAFNAEDIEFVAFAGEFRLDKELVRAHMHGKPDPFYKAFFTEWTDNKRRREFREINRHIGGEITLLNIVSVRTGYLIDIVGARYEKHEGFGLSLFNHFSFDWGTIFSPEGYMRHYARQYDPNATGSTGARHKQWQISFTATRILNWSEEDLYWYRAIDGSR